MTFLCLQSWTATITINKQTNKITVVPKRYYGYTLLFNYTYAAFKSFSFFF